MTAARPSLNELEPGANFVARHIGPDQAERSAMLKLLGAAPLDAFIDDVVPAKNPRRRPLDLPAGKAERTALSYLRTMAERNQVFTSMIGMGYYGTVTPKVILRNVLENPGWYTAYTPYQAEVSQGRLEALLIFQQMVIDLTGLALANASLLDEGTAAAEAMAMAQRAAKSSGQRLFRRPRYPPADHRRGRNARQGLRLRRHHRRPAARSRRRAGFRRAAFLSRLLRRSARFPHRRSPASTVAGALAVMATDLLALAILAPPGELGADIAVGSAQRFGVPMGYGGPHAAFFAARDEFRRTMPGRIIGVSVDSEGSPAMRMALQTREQHIRREKATSNICTAQVLLAVIAAMFAVYNGPAGIRKSAARTHRLAEIFAAAVRSFGYEVSTKAFFDTVTLHVPGRARMLLAKAREKRINLRYVDADRLGVSFDQATRREELEKLLACFRTDAAESR